VLTELRAMLGIADPKVAIHRFGDVSPAVDGGIRGHPANHHSITLLIVFVVMFGVMNVVSTNLDGSRPGNWHLLLPGCFARFPQASVRHRNPAGQSVRVLHGNRDRSTLTVWVLNGIGFETQDVGLQMVFGGDRLHLVISVASIAWLTGVLLLVTAATAFVSLGGALKVSPVAALRETRD
jgi:ABC-type antimicrobial peptide transport system permease subunit